MSEYKHRPDQGPGGDKQFLLYMLLAFVMVVVLQGMFTKQQPKPAATAPQPAASTPAPQTQSPSATTAATQPAAPTPAQQKVETKQASAEGEITVDDDLFRVVLTNRGGQARSWVLKKFKNDKGEPLDLVNQKASAVAGLPLSLWTYDETLRKKLNDALYVVSVEGCKSAAGQAVKIESPAPSQSCEFSQQMSVAYDFAEG